MQKRIPLILFCTFIALAPGNRLVAQEIKFDPKTTVFVEAESFDEKGGWVVDQQFTDIMGSSMLLAHGLGKPVADARTTVKFPQAGTYRVFVRTRNWAAVWTPQHAPGRFQLVVNGKTLNTTFGTEEKEWHWQRGDDITVTENQWNAAVALHDLTGFNGRVDAICFTLDPNFTPPNDLETLNAYRRTALGLPDVAPDAEGGPFDLVVVGGGIAGTCTAISAARLGLNVALVQDRPLVGGNNSSEVRVHSQGRINLPPYPNLGNLVAQMNHRRKGNAMPADYYEDERKMNLLAAESGVKTFFNTRAVGVEKDGPNRIKAVVGKHIETGEELRFVAPLFADCTGDGNLGYYAGADWRMGRESRDETGESLAPEVADKMTMGTSVQWYSVETDGETTFPELPWAIQFNDNTAKPMLKGDWNWETGLNLDQIWDFEQIRDHGLRAAFGHWAYMKNQAGGDWPEQVRNRELGWVAYIGGKRESRRLLGDVILQEQDIVGRREWPDASVTTSWTIDLHYPSEENAQNFPGEAFMTVAQHKRIEPYAIPYRCFYSRNIDNLFMAGRDISVTHVALGTIRVQHTGGMMGEVVGMAASLCKKHNTLPRGVYENHLDELKALMQEGVAPPPVPKSSVAASKPTWLKDAGENVARKAKVKVSSLYPKGKYPASHINDGQYDLASDAGRWVSNEDTEHWVTFEWEQPVKINAVRILSGQVGNGEPTSPITDFVLQDFRSKWKNTPGTEITENGQCDFGCKFPTVKVKQLRLLITNTPRELARLWEVEFYYLP
ncbi:MAG: FAD-dependent oxidoreductase [Planctomycetaceae bacterium]|nr:FAD-dependent oxidoreductase [Planctomycetaceae bacterium]